MPARGNLEERTHCVTSSSCCEHILLSQLVPCAGPVLNISAWLWNVLLCCEYPRLSLWKAACHQQVLVTIHCFQAEIVLEQTWQKETACAERKGAAVLDVAKQINLGVVARKD